MAYETGSTPRGNLPPWEVAKAVAFEQVIMSMEEHMEKTCWQLLGQSRADFTAEHLTLVGGGKPTGRAVKMIWAKVKDDDGWFPGKKPENQGGRPPQISVAQKRAIADKAMELKQDLVAPTPERVRICLPRKTINKKTKAPISDFSIRRVFQTLC